MLNRKQQLFLDASFFFSFIPVWILICCLADPFIPYNPLEKHLIGSECVFAPPHILPNNYINQIPAYYYCQNSRHSSQWILPFWHWLGCLWWAICPGWGGTACWLAGWLTGQAEASCGEKVSCFTAAGAK